MGILLIDGPLGTELNARGIATPLPLWSAAALTSAPESIAQIHREYADAGATVHTANTFRTSRRSAGRDWRALAQTAVALAREAIAPDHRLAGSIAPLEDCYRPDLSPPKAEAEHQLLADHLAALQVDLLLCETFPHVGEAVAATRAAARTGLEVWTSFTAGPNGDLLTPDDVSRGSEAVLQAGASAVLLNCTAPRIALPFLARLTPFGVPIGVYANAGQMQDGLGWGDPEAPDAYAELAATWVAAGATIIGSCCGTGPAHTKALAKCLLQR